jgi:UDP-glucose/iron transport system ATP-binding protein
MPTQPTGLHVNNVSPQGRGPYSLHIAGGECVSLRGASGSGKSLLLRAIADLDPYSGDILLERQNSRLIAAPLWRKQVALLSAESLWWYDDVGSHFDNKTCPWFEALGFQGDTLQWQVSRLSSGEKQRLALARLLMNQPRVLLLDEPTASLDSDNALLVEDLIKHYQHDSGAAVLWVSHDQQQAARVADRHLFLDAETIQDDAACLAIKHNANSPADNGSGFSSGLIINGATNSGPINAKDTPV